MAATLSLPFDVAVPRYDDARRIQAGTPLAEDRSHGRGGPTLDDVILGAWDGVTAHAAVACPVCRGKMVPRYGSEPVPVGGRCRRCGTTLG